MPRFSRSRAIFGAAILIASGVRASGQAFFASDVITYSAGTNNSYQDPTAALGKPNADTGFGILTPFNGAYSSSDIAGIGAGGTLTLKLAETTGAVGYSMGIHAAVGIIDNDWPNGNAGAQATPYTNPRIADVQVSFDGTNWVNLGTQSFTIPTNYYSQGISTPGYQDSPDAGAVEADWSKPFEQPLSSFDVENWTQMLATLNTSAGGDWSNLNATQLPGINYVRFNVAGDAAYPMIVDAVVGNTGNQVVTGTLGVSDSAPIVESPTGTIVTNNGTVTVTDAMAIMGSSPNPASSFINHGTLRTTAAGGSSFLVPVYSDTGTFDVQAGTLTLNGRFITGTGTTTKSGNGTLVVAGQQIHNAGSVLDAIGGMTDFQTDAGGLSIVTEATVQLDSEQHLAGMHIAGTGAVVAPAGGSRNLYTNGLQIDAGGKLDLNDHDLVVNYTGTSPFSSLWQMVLQGYSDSPDPSKTGIISTIGQNTGGTRLLMLFDNASVGAAEWPPGSGQTIEPNAVVGTYTYFGDTNLDGQVTGDDYGAIDANLGQTNLDPGTAILMGDTNFDGRITGDDYAAIDANLGLGAQTPGALALAVPEPAAVSSLLVFAAELLRRRRRR